ncbi:MAG: cbb3-type cytochrome c oxidase subunit I [Planctomycetes bacterium]|nr:cbb3-type cytochrome c oxidase subunit I [Planctomycetota bacterium]
MAITHKQGSDAAHGHDDHGHGVGDAHDHGPTGFISKYIFSFDHKVIGIQYLLLAIGMSFIGVGLSFWFRTQLAWPGHDVMTPEQYVSFVTMHGTIMIFFVVSAALSSGLGNLAIPLQIGARDMAFPLLNMLSFWTILPAALIMIASFFVEGGASGGGWTVYPPLSALRNTLPGAKWGTTLWLLAMALFIVSFTMGGLNYTATILNLRARGMSLMRMPLTIWCWLIATLLGLLGFPALTAAAIMLLLDRHGGTSFFLPSGLIVSGEPMANVGGTPLLFQHLFWFLGHPEVYVLVLPAIGVAFDVIATFARRPPQAYRYSVYSLLVIALLGMVVWGHHMFVSGMNPYLGKYFSISTLLITAPFAILGVNLVGSLWKARIRFTTPMLFALGLVSAVGTGGIGGLFLATSTADLHFHDTYFVVGHFHLMIGVVTLTGTFAGIYYWFPKMFGRMMNETLGKIHFWTTIIGTFAVFTIQHFQGLGGLTRRYYEYSAQVMMPAASLNPMVTMFAFLAGAGQLVFFVNFFWSALRGPKAGENPWDATTLEWTTPSPPGHGNWPGALPVVTGDPYGYATGPDGNGFRMQNAKD